MGNFQGIIVTLVIVGILIGVAFLVLSSLRTNMSTTSNIAYKETVNPTDTGVYLANNQTSVKCFSGASIVNVTNESGAAAGANVLTAGNYTVNPTTGLFRNLSRNQLYAQNWNVTYTYNSGDEACQGIVDTMNATKTIPSFLPIIVIIAIVGILLVIVFNVIPKAGGRETAYV